MRIKVISFTKKGIELSVQLKEKLDDVLYQRNKVAPVEDLHCKLFTACKTADFLPPHVTYTNEPLQTFAEDGFKHYDGIIFIGACGIAVRAIAPWVKDKFEDVPVLVMDELSGVIIPILSGHLGGANRLAMMIAGEMDLQPVITTATDLHRKFAVDLFAADNDLKIENREGIAAVSAKILAGEDVTFSIEGDVGSDYLTVLKQLKMIPYEKNQNTDILISTQNDRKNGSIVLRPKEYVVGIGCKRGTSFEKLDGFIKEVFEENGLDSGLICAVASIDLKRKEEGIHQISKRRKIPFVMLPAETLESIKGDFSSSEIQPGSSSSPCPGCSRLSGSSRSKAVAGEGGELIVSKTAKDGMTIAVAKRKFRIVFELPEKAYANRKNTVFVVGMGPGEEKQMTGNALAALEESDVIVGYPVYLELLPERLKNKKCLSTPMRQEKERCILAFEEAAKGQTVSMVCSGDAGIYGMASLIYEIGERFPDTEIEIIPGITAACSGAAVLGAPLNHDFCVISLSDLLTPWEIIEARLEAAAKGDFAIAIYNPSSRKRADHLKKACEILLREMEPERPCGYVRNIGRENTEVYYCTLEELKDREADMFTTVFIGNSTTEMIGGKMVTKRGYVL